MDILLYRAVSGDEPDEFDLFVVADLDGLQAIEDVPSQADLDRSSGACLDEVDELRFHASIVTKERRLGYVPLCLRDDRLVTAAYNRFRGLRARGILEGRFDGRDAALLLRCGPSTR